MGCIGSTILRVKHCLWDKKFERQFQIPDIVIDEYISRTSLNKCINEDYVWLTETSHLSAQWFVHNCDALEAETLLRDKPNGTFLVRESRRHKGHYVLAVSLHYFVNQMLIYQTDEGFGLIDPGVHPTLDSLITHYSQVSLIAKNPLLDTKLIRGVFQTD